MAGAADVEELSVTKEGITLKSVALNTLATVATMIGMAVIGVLVWQHQQESREAGAAFVGALKEQTTAMKEGTAVAREQNCLLKFDQKDRQQNADFCKQITGAPR